MRASIPVVRRVSRRKVAHQPENDVLQTRILGQRHQEHDHGRAKGVHHDPGKQQSVFLQYRRSGRHDEDQNEGREAAYKSTEGDTGKPGQSQHDADDGADGRSARYPQDIGLCQRVSEQRLKDQPTQGKRCAHHDCQQDPRKPEMPDNCFQCSVRISLPENNGQGSPYTLAGRPAGKSNEQRSRQYTGKQQYHQQEAFDHGCWDRHHCVFPKISGWMSFTSNSRASTRRGEGRSNKSESTMSMR